MIPSLFSGQQLAKHRCLQGDMKIGAFLEKGSVAEVWHVWSICSDYKARMINSMMALMMALMMRIVDIQCRLCRLVF